MRSSECLEYCSTRSSPKNNSTTSTSSTTAVDYWSPSSTYIPLSPLLLCSSLPHPPHLPHLPHLPLQDVLDFSKIEGGCLELEDRPFSLVDAVESSVHMCYDLAKDRNLAIVYEFDPSCPSVKSLPLIILQFYILP